MRIKINNKVNNVKRLSELSFREFNEIIIKGEALELPEYLAIQCDISAKELMNSELKGISLPSIYQQLFNVDIDKVVKDKKETVKYNGKIYLTDDLSVDTFGKSYLFELKRQKQEEGAITYQELSVYALAIGISESMDGSDIDDIYKDLCGYNWISVLPQGFFLFKRTKKTRIKRLLLSMIYIGALKMIRLKMAYFLKRLILSEKKSLSSYFARG